MADFVVHHGSKDMLELVDDMREKIVAGKVDGVAIAFTDTAGCTFTQWAYRKDATAVWARLVAALSSVLNRMVKDGL